MKNLIVTAFSILFSLGMFAQTSTSNLPSTAQNFIQENFSEVSIAEVKENSYWQIWEDEKYEVKLSNGIELDFDENGNIIEIESDNDVAIPLTALPSKIAQYLQGDYPEAQVTGWEKGSKKQEVELIDGTDLEFDAEGNFRKID